MRWTFPLLFIAFSGCSEDDVCGAGGTQFTDTNRGEYCVYSEAGVVVEGGFRCPAALPARLDIGGVRICSGTPENVRGVPKELCDRFLLSCASQDACASTADCPNSEQCVAGQCLPEIAISETTTVNLGVSGIAAAEDLTGDSVLDIAAVGGANGFGLFVGDGRGNFSTSDEGPAALMGEQNGRLGDLNNDGFSDLVLGSICEGSSVWLGGPGGFAAGQDLAFSSGCEASDLAIEDIDNDGNQDLVLVGAQSVPGGGVRIHLGTGDGRFQDAPVHIDTHGFGHYPPVFADFNRDGIRDYALLVERVGPGSTPPVSPTQEDLGRVHVALGTGDGTFVTGAHILVGALANDLAVADVNLDGILDVLATSEAVDTSAPANGALHVALGRGDGTFVDARVVPGTGTGPAVEKNLVAADFNGDGFPDVVVSTVSGTIAPIVNELVVLLGFGDGTFGALEPLRLNERPVQLLMGDVNGDGTQDLLRADAEGPIGESDLIVTVLTGV